MLIYVLFLSPLYDISITSNINILINNCHILFVVHFPHSRLFWSIFDPPLARNLSTTLKSPDQWNSAPDLVKSEANGESKPKVAAGEVDEDEVKLVVAQTGCTEDEARTALKEESGDLINASTY